MLHSAAEGCSSLQLARYVLRNELRVQIGALYLNDIECNGLANLFCQSGFQLLNACAALPITTPGFAV